MHIHFFVSFKLFMYIGKCIIHVKVRVSYYILCNGGERRKMVQVDERVLYTLQVSSDRSILCGYSRVASDMLLLCTNKLVKP